LGGRPRNRVIGADTCGKVWASVPCHVSISMDWVNRRTKDHFQDSPQKWEPKAKLFGRERKSVNLKAILSS
jgi:hypothetical protein